MSWTQISLTLVSCVLSAMLARADESISDQSDAERNYRRPSIIVPFAFSTEALDTGIGATPFSRHYGKAARQSNDVPYFD